MDWKLILAGIAIMLLALTEIAIVLLALTEIDHEIRLDDLKEMICEKEEEDEREH